MVRRILQKSLTNALNTMPVVALLGPRQVGKTTLALEFAKSTRKKTAYLDLELDTDQAKLSDPEAYLRRFPNTLLRSGPRFLDSSISEISVCHYAAFSPSGAPP